MENILVKPSFQPNPRFVSVEILPSDPTEREPEVVRQPEPPEPKDWRTIIVDRIRSDEISYNLLGQEAKVSPAIISRFVRGERDITLSVAYRLCQALDLVLVPREQCR